MAFLLYKIKLKDMAFVPNFSISQITGQPSILTLADTSTGSDVAIVSRNVYLQTASGTYLVPTGTTTSYIVWAIANSTISINALDKDYSLNITVNWNDVLGAVLYTKTILSNFSMYNSDFEYSLISTEANGQASLNSINWLASRMRLRLSLDDAYNAVVEAGSITNGQAANDRGTYLRENLNLFY